MKLRIPLTVVATGALVATSALAASASVDMTPRSCAQPDGRVTSIAISGNTAYVAGNFTRVMRVDGVSETRTRLAAINTETCELLDWSASANAEVLDLEVVGSTLYVAGSFTTINGVARQRLAALATSDAALLDLKATIDRPVRALTSTGGTLYAGGDFRKVNGSARGRLAAFSTSTDDLQSWKPKAVGNVDSLAAGADGRIYVGGRFSSLAGSAAAAYLGAVSASTGALDSDFLPRPGFPVATVITDSRGVYAGGGGAGGHLGIWNLDGSRQQDVYQTDGGVQALAVDGDSLYVGGHFTNYCIGNTGSGSPYNCDRPDERRKAFEVSLSSGSLTDWAPRLNSPRGIFALAVDANGHLWAGGDFTKVGSQAVSRLAVFD